MFKYPVLTKDEINEMNKPLAEGIYDFEVFKSNVMKSKFDPDLENLVLNHWVYDSEGKKYNLSKFIPADEKGAAILLSFWESVGEAHNYNGENHENDYLDKCGKVSVKNRKDTKTGKVIAFIDEYLPADNSEISVKKDSDDFINDDVPF